MSPHVDKIKNDAICLQFQFYIFVNTLLAEASRSTSHNQLISSQKHSAPPDKSIIIALGLVTGEFLLVKQNRINLMFYGLCWRRESQHQMFPVIQSRNGKCEATIFPTFPAVCLSLAVISLQLHFLEAWEFKKNWATESKVFAFKKVSKLFSVK